MDNQVKLKNQKYIIKLSHLYGFKKTRAEIDTILVEEPHIQSAAHLILLKKQYYKMDSTYRNKSIHDNWRIWLTFRNRLLRRWKKERGELICFYCHQSDLTANINSPYAHNREATLDHYIPQAKGGKKFDEKNLRICCNRCNNNKKDMMPEEFVA